MHIVYMYIYTCMYMYIIMMYTYMLIVPQLVHV